MRYILTIKEYLFLSSKSDTDIYKHFVINTI